MEITLPIIIGFLVISFILFVGVYILADSQQECEDLPGYIQGTGNTNITIPGYYLVNTTTLNDETLGYWGYPGWGLWANRQLEANLIDAARCPLVPSDEEAVCIEEKIQEGVTNGWYNDGGAAVLSNGMSVANATHRDVMLVSIPDRIIPGTGNTTYGGWSGVCLEAKIQTESSYALLLVILIVFAAVAILAVLKYIY